jgi:ParB family transcriptional regulator, chromosome partitioning protein
MNHEVKVVPIEAIEIEDGFNPRQHVDDELADSIRRHGVLQPVLVRPKPDSDERWLLVDGQRRITAARKEGHKEIPVSVRADLDNNGLAAALVTALKRKDLDPVEEAHAYQRLIEGGLTKRGAAQTIGVPQKTITARLQILALPEKLRPLVAAGTIPLSAVAELARMAGFSTRLAERVGAEGASSGRFDFWVAEQIARGIKTLHPTNDIDVDALKLDAAAREKIDALSDSWSKWRPRLREQDLDRARAAGVLHEEPRHRTESSWASPARSSATARSPANSRSRCSPATGSSASAASPISVARTASRSPARPSTSATSSGAGSSASGSRSCANGPAARTSTWAAGCSTRWPAWS